MRMIQCKSWTLFNNCNREQGGLGNKQAKDLKYNDTEARISAKLFKRQK